MEIKTTTVNVVTPKDLAIALKHSTPSEFAKFWFEFSEMTERDDKLIDSFAREMAPSMGGYRKRALNKICDLMKYYEIKTQKNA